MGLSNYCPATIHVPGDAHTPEPWISASFPLIVLNEKDATIRITLNLTQLICLKEIIYKHQYSISDKVVCDHS